MDIYLIEIVLECAISVSFVLERERVRVCVQGGCGGRAGWLETSIVISSILREARTVEAAPPRIRRLEDPTTNPKSYPRP